MAIEPRRLGPSVQPTFLSICILYQPQGLLQKQITMGSDCQNSPQTPQNFCRNILNPLHKISFVVGSVKSQFFPLFVFWSTFFGTSCVADLADSVPMASSGV